MPGLPPLPPAPQTDLQLLGSLDLQASEREERADLADEDWHGSDLLAALVWRRERLGGGGTGVDDAVGEGRGGQGVRSPCRISLANEVVNHAVLPLLTKKWSS